MPSHWDLIRNKARIKRDVAQVRAGGSVTAEDLIRAAEHITGIAIEGVAAGDPLLDGGEAALDIEVGIIWFNRDLEPELARLYQAHEHAHFWLDGEHTICLGPDVDVGTFDEDLPLGIQRVEGYSPEERSEREANIFAREFLLPTDSIRHWYIEDKLSASEIATKVGVPEGIVFHQLTRALLTVEASINDELESGEGGLELDLSQEKASRIEQGPFLLEAGPGTGKTRTLIGRILFLLDQGVTPDAILALTFSNKAAEEMRSRVASVRPDAAAHIWMGTFHAFGLELLRKYGSRLGLPARPNVIDPVDALFLLEQHLPSLELNFYQNLYEPTTFLRDILQAISRAKDELVGPGKYAELADQMSKRATTNDEIEAAEKAQEVARVYAYYQAYLERENFLDFGDLIFRAVTLLRAYPDVRDHIQATYSHILVDEYQDVNRASGLLLGELAGDGKGLWVVGDTRQSIYRFRGAAPANIRLFTTDFPGAQASSLKYNYRSRPSIVGLFSALLPEMKASQGVPFVPWEVERDDLPGTLIMEVAENGEAEGLGIARKIEQLKKRGIRYQDQAVLCRTHTQLAQIASSLEEEGVPVLSLGNLLERHEVRDLLSLLSLASEGGGQAIVRVAHFDEYDIPLIDVLALLTRARKEEIPFPRALGLVDSIPAISEQGRNGLRLLSQHLQGICYGNNAWRMLVHYLFDRSNYIRLLLRDESVKGQQNKLAILQLLQLAYEQREISEDGVQDQKRAFLNYVRKLEWYGATKQLRQIPEAVSSIDAVRLLTVHAAKGLEFEAVFVPFLGRGRFPSRRRWSPCPPPEGLLVSAPEAHEEEEECLFFVAISRARDVLCLSRANRYGRSNSRPSDLLTKIAHILPYPPDGPITWRSDQSEHAESSRPVKMTGRRVFPLTNLEVYMRCPRQYFYEFLLALGGRSKTTPYILFHRSVYKALRWLQKEKEAGKEIGADDALKYLAKIWIEQGPVDHPYESIYRQRANEMVKRAVQQHIYYRSKPIESDWEVPLANGILRFRPDRIISSQEGSHSTTLIQRLRTGRPTKGEVGKDIYALYQEAAHQYFPETNIKVQAVYLSTDESFDIVLTTRKINTRLGHYEAAMAGICRKDFPPAPSDRLCPQCPYYFICPIAAAE